MNSSSKFSTHFERLLILEITLLLRNLIMMYYRISWEMRYQCARSRTAVLKLLSRKWQYLYFIGFTSFLPLYSWFLWELVLFIIFFISNNFICRNFLPDYIARYISGNVNFLIIIFLFCWLHLLNSKVRDQQLIVLKYCIRGIFGCIESVSTWRQVDYFQYFTSDFRLN